MKSLVQMTTVAAMAGMIVGLAGLQVEAGRHGGGHGGHHNDTKYRVELRHPTTGGVVQSVVKDTAAEADAVRAQYARVHWKFWKYVGIGEPLHSKQFSSESAASNYTPPFGVIATQYVRAGRVSVTPIEVSRRGHN